MRERSVSVESLKDDIRFPIRKSRFNNDRPCNGEISFNELNDKLRILTLGTLDAKSFGKTVNLIAASSRYCKL